MKCFVMRLPSEINVGGPRFTWFYLVFFPTVRFFDVLKNKKTATECYRVCLLPIFRFSSAVLFVRRPALDRIGCCKSRPLSRTPIRRFDWPKSETSNYGNFLAWRVRKTPAGQRDWLLQVASTLKDADPPF